MVDLESVSHLISNELTFENTLYKVKNLNEIRKIIVNTDDFYIGDEHSITELDLIKILKSNSIDYSVDRLLVTDVFCEGECIKTEYSLVKFNL